jgi:hypothetical protein
VNCGCHDEPAYWQKDKRYGAGGFWRCPVRARELARSRYDRKPIYRLEKLLKANASKRRANLARRRTRLLTDREGETDRKVSH